MNKLKILSKIKLFFRKPRIIIIAGNGREASKRAIFAVLSKYFQDGKDFSVKETDDEEVTSFENIFKVPPGPILLVTHVGEIPIDKDSFAGDKEKIKETEKIIKRLPSQTHLVINYDDETLRAINGFLNLQTIKFGFNDRADIFSSDLKINGGTNFKVNYKGSIVPIWLNGIYGKEKIYAALSAVSIGVIFGLNLVEISQALKEYPGS